MSVWKHGVRPAQAGFMVSVGVRHPPHKDADCAAALAALKRAGFACAPTSGDTILELAEQERRVRELAENVS